MILMALPVSSGIAENTYVLVTIFFPSTYFVLVEVDLILADGLELDPKFVELKVNL